jgi:hypothetical protein
MTQTQQDQDLDPARAEAFAGQLITDMTGSACSWP